MSNDTRISTQIQALQTDKANIRQAILDKNGTCAEGNGFDSFATDIATIPSGITPSGSLSITRNDTYDVTNYAQAVVNVSGGGGGTIAVLEGDTTATSINYLLISHQLGKAPIYAECTRTDGASANTMTRAFNVAGWLTTDSSNEYITLCEYYNGSSVRTNYFQDNARSDFTSKMTSTQVRFGGGSSTRQYSGTYHYKIYYEA